MLTERLFGIIFGLSVTVLWPLHTDVRTTVDMWLARVSSVKHVGNPGQSWQTG